MQMRSFGSLGQVSALTLGGGGIGSVWGTVERAEAVATVRAALDAGITMLDVAPGYGSGEAELVVGEALGGAVPDGVLITTKVELPDDAPEVLERKLADSLRASMQRLRVERVDLLLLHSQLQPDDGPSAPRLLSVRPFREVVRPAFERLREEGVIGGWGLTDVGHPRALLEVLSDDSLPDAIQCVANALDLSGDMWLFGPEERPDNAGMRARAVQAGVSVIGIRAVAAGSLAERLDRPVEADHPAARDYEAAASFRSLAAGRGESAALLAHRYALSMPDLATVVLGVRTASSWRNALPPRLPGPSRTRRCARSKRCEARDGGSRSTPGHPRCRKDWRSEARVSLLHYQWTPPFLYGVPVVFHLPTMGLTNVVPTVRLCRRAARANSRSRCAATLLYEPA
jgi:aryl-alcohol dehydrogenase-like predicted oxidoreductase